MKHFYLFAALAVAALASCSTKSNDKATEINELEAQQVEQSVVAVAPVATDGKVIELTNPTLLPVGVNVEQLTVVDFNAVWCGPCRQLAPVLEQMAEKYKGKATFISVDVDNYPELFKAYQMGNAIPAVLILRPDGKTLKYIGTDDLLPAEKFEAIIDANL